MLIKGGSDRIVNFMTFRAGVLVIEHGHIGHIVQNYKPLNTFGTQMQYVKHFAIIVTHNVLLVAHSAPVMGHSALLVALNTDYIILVKHITI